MNGSITKPVENTRMANQREQEGPASMITPSMPPTPQGSTAGAPAPGGTPTPGGTPSQVGPALGNTPTGPETTGSGDSQFLNAVADVMTSDQTWQGNVDEIKAGPEGAASVVVQVGADVFDQFKGAGKPPNEDEQAAALEMLIDDVVDIGIGEGSLAGSREQVEYQVGQLALQQWSQRYNIPIEEMTQSIAGDATPEDMAAAESLHNSFNSFA